MRVSSGFFLVLAVGLACVIPGCHAKSAPPASTANSGVKQYHVRGVVVSTDATKGEVMLDTEAIPGFMEAMTMPYSLRNPGIISELHPGDTITATLYASNDSDTLDQIVVVGQAKADYLPPVQYQPLVPGESVPNFKLRNQSDKTISLDQFRGKVLLVTFIYTRCPLATYCPRMSRNFAEIDKALKADPALYGKTHLLSVSFDPEHDTPERLRARRTRNVGGLLRAVRIGGHRVERFGIVDPFDRLADLAPQFGLREVAAQRGVGAERRRLQRRAVDGRRVVLLAARGRHLCNDHSALRNRPSDTASVIGRSPP